MTKLKIWEMCMEASNSAFLKKKRKENKKRKDLGSSWSLSSDTVAISFLHSSCVGVVHALVFVPIGFAFQLDLMSIMIRNSHCTRIRLAHSTAELYMSWGDSREQRRTREDRTGLDKRDEQLQVRNWGNCSHWRGRVHWAARHARL